MKQLKLFLAALMCLLTSATSFADDTPIPVDQLPVTAKTFVQTSFKNKKIMLKKIGIPLSAVSMMAQKLNSTRKVCGKRLIAKKVLFPQKSFLLLSSSM